MSASAVKAGRAFVELGVHDKKFVQGLLVAQRRLRAFGRKIDEIGQRMRSVGQQAAQLGISAGLPIAFAVKRYADFDDAMRMVKATSGATEKQFETLTNKAAELGRTTSFTATEVASLMVELSRAGFDPSEIDRMTGSVLDLAKATGTDADKSAGFMSATINQFGLGADEATRVADVLAATANSSFNTLEQLGEALSYAGPAAADANMSLEETAAILGTLGNAGIHGSMAGSALRRLLTMSGAQAEKFKEIFGVSFKDAEGNTRPLIDALSEVHEATKDLGTAERAKKFDEAFGLLGITGASVIGKNSVGANDLLGKLQGSDGYAKKTAEEMESGVGGTFRRIFSAIEGVAIQVGSSIEKSIKFLEPIILDIAAATTEWIQENQGLIATVGWIVGGVVAFGAALFLAGSAVSIIGFAIGGMGTAISVVMSTVGLATTVLGGLGAAITFLASPIGIATVAILGVVAAFVYLSGTGDEIIAWFYARFTELTGIVSTTMGGMYDAIIGGNLSLAAEIAFLGMKGAIASVLKSILGIFGATIETMSQMLAEIIKRTASVVGRLEQMRTSAQNWITGQVSYWALGVDSSVEQAAQTRRANQFASSMNSFDANRFAKGIEDSLDSESIMKQLEALREQAKKSTKKEEKAAEKKDKDPDGIDKKIKDIMYEIPTGVKKAVDQGKTAFGSFSAQEAGRFRAVPENLQKRTAIASEETAKHTKQIAKKARQAPVGLRMT